jgi:hypothetical protein
VPLPRLFVIMARDAPVAVVLRRGPASWAQLTLWNTESDRFIPGVWIRGRIYEDACDLSPDGELLVSAVFQGRRPANDLHAVVDDGQQAASLHALVLWPMGTTYGGGGRFVENRRLVLRGAGEAHPQHPLHGIDVVPGNAPHRRSTDEVDGAPWSGRDQRNHSPRMRASLADR